MSEEHKYRPKQVNTNNFIKSFGFKNFRVFKDYTNFELKPFTILTGTNNSGKSTVNKALLLMKGNQNNLNNGSHGVLNYFGGQHNLGNHEMVKNIKNENSCFYFTFHNKYQIAFEVNPNGVFLFDYSITYDSEPVISPNGGVIQFNFNRLIEYFKERINHTKLEDPDKFLLFISRLEKESKKGFHSVHIDLYDHFWVNEKNMIKRDYDFRVSELKNKCEELKGKGIFSTIYELNLTKISNAYNFVDEDTLDEDLCFTLIYVFNELTGIQFTKQEAYNLIPFAQLKEQVGLKYSKPLISFDPIFYIPTIKEQLKRSYSSSEKSLISDLIYRKIQQPNHWSENTLKHVINIRKDEKEQELHFFYLVNIFAEKWLQEFDIGEKLSYGYNDETDTFYIKIDDKNLPEYGFGYSQVLYLIFALHNETIPPDNLNSILYFPSTYIIEEPETGLHPAFQSKIAEMIVDAYKSFGVNFIIETHSEYFIRKLQLLTANKTITPDETVIYYFNNPKYFEPNENLVKEINIDEHGGLSDSFGKGFFDEATSLKFELINLNKKRNN